MATITSRERGMPSLATPSLNKVVIDSDLKSADVHRAPKRATRMEKSALPNPGSRTKMPSWGGLTFPLLLPFWFWELYERLLT